MSGRHAVSSKGPRTPPPVPDVERTGVRLAVPNRERMTYLTRLAERFTTVPGFCAGFGYRAHEVVLYVIATSAGPARNRPSPIGGVTVRCVYEDGQWWFARGGDGSRFAAANDLSTAETIVRRAIENPAVPA
ncbi:MULTISPECIES: hypothetical protein [Actinomadura]|uniref:Uncharacterized protein n=1 Tax=Actinomadura yumaensis TaxID=111807 RepID=A0ABW2CRW7_9ACTN|nr:hypothetical protein [Actinomadura sp. J1-007]MWK35445.1 hypothetical protein [Actinomadura sp. J1-007]